MLIKPFPQLDTIHPVIIPLGNHSLITVNCYLLGKGPLTLIDTGPKFSGGLEIIRHRVEGLGCRLEDIERIIITHGHMDHFGLAGMLQETLGRRVDCFIHAQDSHRVLNESQREYGRGEEADRFLAMVDMPASEVRKVRERFEFLNTLCDPIEEPHLMEEGVEFEGEGYHLEVIHTPGHSPGNCCLYETRQNVLFSGDHIIKHLTPNPMVEMNRKTLIDPGYQSLREYRHSLDKLKDMEVEYVFPGHGEYIEDLKGIIASYHEHHRQRMNLVWEALHKRPRPLFKIIDEVFPYVPPEDIFFAVSEIYVHLEILLNEGRAELIDSGPPAIYRAQKPPPGLHHRVF